MKLAEMAMVHPCVISHFENGRRSPSVKNVMKLCDALECTSDFLLGRTEDIVEMELSDLRHRVKLAREILG